MARLVARGLAAFSFALGAAMLFGACRASGVEWRPRNPKVEYPARREVAVRVKEDQVPERAERIGVVHSEGTPGEVIAALAEEAAEHGGTHYVVKGDDSDAELVTTGGATQIGSSTVYTSRTRVQRSRHIWAAVYRDCNPKP